MVVAGIWLVNVKSRSVIELTAAFVFSEGLMRAVGRFGGSFEERKEHFSVHGDHSSGFCYRLANCAARERDDVLQFYSDLQT